MTDTLAAIAARHVPTATAKPYCRIDGDEWPCDAARLAALLSPERLAAALELSGLRYPCYHTPEAVLAALTSEESTDE